MTGPPTEAASISLELKDDAKQERVSRIASPGWCSVPLSFCVPPIQHIEAISPPKNSSGGCIGFGLLELRTPRPPVAARYLEICEIQNPPRGLKPGPYPPEYLNESEAPNKTGAGGLHQCKL